MLGARQPQEGEGLLDGFLDPAGQPRILARPFAKPGGEIGFCLVEVAAIIEPSELLQTIVAVLARQMIERISQEVHVGAVEEVLCI